MIELGTAVLAYNQWTKYENPDISEHFRRPTAEEVCNLKPGDVFWKVVDPLHPNGKVYGYVKMRILKIEGGFIYYEGGGYSGKMNDDRLVGPLLVDDEQPLEVLIASDPRVTDVIG